MEDLVNTEFFSLLAESSQEVTNQEIQNAYGSFVKHIENLNQSEKDYITIFRALNLTRIEFISLQSLFEYEQGKKCA